MHNRQQYVQLYGNISEFMKIKFGVPQRSVLGPKLFILYINDIINVSKLLQFTLFTDENNFVFSSRDDFKVLSERKINKMIELKIKIINYR